MIKTKNFNNISPELKKKLKVLKAGQAAVYELKGLTPDPERPGFPIMPNIQTVNAQDVIFDPHLNDGKGEYVPVAAILAVNAKGEETFATIAFTKAAYGKIILRGGNQEDQLIYEHLQLSPKNQDSLCPNDAVTTTFKELVTERESEREVAARKERRELLNMIADWNESEMLEYADALSIGLGADPATRRNLLEKYAEENPQEMLKMSKNSSSGVKAHVVNGFKTKILTFDKDNSEIVWTDSKTPIVGVPRTTGTKKEDVLVTYFVSDPIGRENYTELVRRLNEAPKA